MDPTGAEGTSQGPGAERGSSRAARKAKRERERALASGLRFAGSRRRWMLMAGALGLSPLLAVISLVVALGKPSLSDVSTQVEADLAAAGSDFPRGDAVMWTGQVIRVWGTWDEKAPTQRAVLLAPFLPQGMDAQAGWNGKGSQQVIYSSINPDPAVRDASHAAVTATYQIQDGTWRCVTVPVFAYKPKDFGTKTSWAFSLAGNPVPTPCLARTGTPEIDAVQGDQAQVEGAADLKVAFLPGFFAAWAASDQAALRQYMVSGVRTVGLGGALLSSPPPQVKEVALFAYSRGETDYLAYVAVVWGVPGSAATLTAIYELPLHKNGAQWSVTGEPTAATQDPWISGDGPAAVGVVPSPKSSGPPAYPNPSPSVVSPNPTFRASATSSSS